MRINNESPVGLATILGLLPALVAVAIFAVLLIVNGGDVDAAVTQTLAVIAGVSLVATAGLRQWRAVAGSREDPPPALPGGVEIGDPVDGA